jgi:hypothetical protein
MQKDPNPNVCPVCNDDISTDRKTVMCNFCKHWFHRPCLHPSFLDRDVTAVKKDYVILICQDCSKNKLCLLSIVPPNNKASSVSAGSQCDLLMPPTHPPIV